MMFKTNVLAGHSAFKRLLEFTSPMPM